MNHVEDEGAISDDLTKGSETVSHLFGAPTIVGDGEVALNEVTKPHIKVD